MRSLQKVYRSSLSVVMLSQDISHMFCVWSPVTTPSKGYSYQFAQSVDSVIYTIVRTSKGWLSLLIDSNPRTKDRTKYLLMKAFTPKTWGFLTCKSVSQELLAQFYSICY